jgi:hypothetical protein
MNNEVAKIENQSSVINAESIILQAIDKDVPIETMEKLLAMRKELEEERARKLFIEEMANFQEKCPIIKKTKIVYNKGGKTERYRYAPLESIIEQVKLILKECGFSYAFKTLQDEKMVTAVCVVSHIGGHSEETQFGVPIMKSDFMNIAQSVASSLTYAKRYTFCDAFGIATMDTDNDANVNTPEPCNKINNDANKKLFVEIVGILNKKDAGKPVFCESEKLDNMKTAEISLTKGEDLTNFRDLVVAEYDRRILISNKEK